MLEEWVWGNGVFELISQHGNSFVLFVLRAMYPAALIFVSVGGVYWLLTWLCDFSPLLTFKLPKLRPTNGRPVQRGHRLNNCIGVLDFLVQTAPLLGLLGTVFGILQVFQDIERTNVINAEVVAPGFGSALETTGLGLLIAFFGLVFRTIFSRQIKESDKEKDKQQQQDEQPGPQTTTKAMAESDKLNEKRGLFHNA